MGRSLGAARLGTISDVMAGLSPPVSRLVEALVDEVSFFEEGRRGGGFSGSPSSSSHDVVAKDVFLLIQGKTKK